MPRPGDINIVIKDKTKAKVDRACKLKARLDKRSCSIDHAVDQAMDLFIDELKAAIEEGKT